MGIDLVVLGLAAVDGRHVERMAEHEVNLLGGAEVSEPIPARDALHSDDEVAA